MRKIQASYNIVCDDKNRKYCDPQKAGIHIFITVHKSTEIIVSARVGAAGPTLLLTQSSDLTLLSAMTSYIYSNKVTD
jgi:hypothetical protein